MKNSVFFHAFLLVFLAFFLPLFFTHAQANPCSGYSGYPTTSLQPGSSNTNAVKQLQCYLVSQNLLTLNDISDGGFGTYGPLTTAAVGNLQAQNSVDNSSGWGDYGPRTIASLQNDDNSTAENSTSPDTSQNLSLSLANQPTFSGTFTSGNTGIGSIGQTNSSPSVNSNTSNTQSSKITSNTVNSNTSSCFAPMNPPYPPVTIASTVTYYGANEGSELTSYTGFYLPNSLPTQTPSDPKYSPNYPYPCHNVGYAAVDSSLIPYGSLMLVSVRNSDTGPIIGQYYYEAIDRGGDVINRTSSELRNFLNTPIPKYVPANCSQYKCEFLPVVDLFVPKTLSLAYKSTITVYPCYFPLSSSQFKCPTQLSIYAN